MQCVVSLAGPQNLPALLDGTKAGKPYHDIWLSRPARADWKEMLRAGSTGFLVKEDQTHCPFYLMHSRADEMVPFTQTEAFYRLLLDHGYTVRFSVLDSALHQNGLTTEIMEDAVRFIREELSLV